MTDPLPLVLVLAAIGLMVGSFLNVCISRLPAGESIAWPGSRCPSCRTPIKWYDNIPVLSFMVLGGRCRACRAAIAMRYPIVELATSGAFALQGLAFGDDLPFLVSRLLFTVMLIVLFGTDLETQRLPNVITLPGIAIGFALSLFFPPGPIDSLIGIALGAGILWAIRWAWFRATGVEAMGLGDVKMLAMIGAVLGWRQVWVVLFLASIAGAVIGLALTAGRGRSMQSKLPFGTFLALAAFAASLIGERLLHWYLSMYQ